MSSTLGKIRIGEIAPFYALSANNIKIQILSVIKGNAVP